MRMLSSLIGENEVFENKGNVFESDEKAPGLFSMFGDQQQEIKEEESISEVKGNTIEEKEEIPEIIEY